MKIKAALVVALVMTSATLSSSGPHKTLAEIQEIVDNGGYKNYPGIVRKYSTPQYPYVLGKHLEVGTVTPRVFNPQALLTAAKMKQEVRVSHARNTMADYCYPIYEELAAQNGVSCTYFMVHIEDHWDNDKNDGKVFSAISDVMEVVKAVAEPVAREMTAQMYDNDGPTRSDEAAHVYHLKNTLGTDSPEYQKAKEDFKRKHFDIGGRDPIIIDDERVYIRDLI